jgi:hypothetical protein
LTLEVQSRMGRRSTSWERTRAGSLHVVRKISLIRDRRTVTVYFGGETPAKDTIVHFFFRFYVCTLRTGEIVPIQRTIKLGAQSDEKGNNFIFLSAPSIVGISCASVLLLTHRTNSNLLPNRQREPPSRAGTTPRHRCVIHSIVVSPLHHSLKDKH